LRVKRVLANNRKRVFVLETSKGIFEYPYSKLRHKPGPDDRLVHVGLDPDLGNQGFAYRLRSGKGDSIHLDYVLDYNCDPGYLCEILLHNLTVRALDLISAQGMSKGEIARRLKTSRKQLDRLLDPAFYGKTINQMVKLLYVLGVSVELVFKKAA
jgi:hypothetical protein